MHRRKFFLATFGATITAGSGCLGSGGDDDSSPADGDEESSANGDGDADEESGGNESGEEGPDDEIGNYDPETVAQTFFEAWDDNDLGTMEDLSHPDGTAINNNADNVEHWSDHDIEIKETSIDIEELDYFTYPSAAVTVRYDLVDADGNEFPNRHQVILVVADEDLLVYNLKEQFNEIQDGPPEGTCPPESSGDAEDLLPRTSEQFFQVVRRDSIGSAHASYRGPDGDRYMVEIAVHDSVAEAEEEVLSLGEFEFGDGRWDAETGLLARHDTATIIVKSERQNADDEIQVLFEEAGCFSNDHIVETSW